MSTPRAQARKLRCPITRGAAYSVVFLFTLTLAMGAANLLWTSHAVNSYKAAQQRAAAVQQRQGQVIGQKLCTTLRKLSALQPPPGSATANPSRAFEQQLHETLSQLGPDIGCK